MPYKKKVRLSKPKKPMLDKYRLKEYSETIEFRDGISALLGTRYRFLKKGHWIMSEPEVHDTFEERVQDWNLREQTMDTNCSLYCLYNELRYSYNKKFVNKIPIPVLYSSVTSLREEMVSNRPRNLALLKSHLPKLTLFGEWFVPDEWLFSGYTSRSLKSDYLLAIRLYQPYN